MDFCLEDASLADQCNEKGSTAMVTLHQEIKNVATSAVSRNLPFATFFLGATMSGLLALFGTWLCKRSAGLEYFRDNGVLLQTFVDSFVDNDPQSPRHDIVVEKRHGFRVCSAWKDGPRLHFVVSARVPGGPTEEYVFAPTRDAQVSLVNDYVGKYRGVEMTFVADKWVYLCYPD